MHRLYDYEKLRAITGLSESQCNEFCPPRIYLFNNLFFLNFIYFIEKANKTTGLFLCLTIMRSKDTTDLRIS
jgi:hypothetical protein